MLDDSYHEAPAHWLSLGYGAAEVPLPDYWSIEKQGCFHALLSVDGIDGAALEVSLQCFNDPQAITDNDLECYANHPAAPRLAPEKLDEVRDKNGVPDFEQLTVFGAGLERDGDASSDEEKSLHF